MGEGRPFRQTGPPGMGGLSVLNGLVRVCVLMVVMFGVLVVVG